MTDREPPPRRPRLDEPPTFKLTLRGPVRIERDNGRAIEGQMAMEWDERDVKALARALKEYGDG